MKMNPFFATDGYKVGHHLQYPKGTKTVYSNFTPRSNKYAPKGCDKVMSFGQQMVVAQINEMFHDEFFSKPKEEVCGEIREEYSMYLGAPYDVSHIEALHDLGYLPVEVKALPEGTLVPMGVPVLTIKNTKGEFYWITNFLETLISNLLWKPMTSATIALGYRKLMTDWCLKTDKETIDFVSFQGHDFSMRGMDSLDATISSGLGHATSFLGSDSLPVIRGARKYYGEKDFVVGSVNATEHSVMCAGGAEEGNELATFRYLMNQFPLGILSIVSDTWDLWKVCTEYLPELKEEIMKRDGKIVIRPDSGDPVDIICGLEGVLEDNEENIPGGYYVWDKDYPGKYVPRYVNQSEVKGVIELLWDVFGGTVNEQGYKVLDPHIGAIYGDSITLERAEQIFTRLEAKGFASTNVVLGIGSFTYQFNTRDTFGFAMKATYVEVEELTLVSESEEGEYESKVVGREIFKDPITDDGTKKSAKGLLAVFKDDNLDYQLHDQVDWATEQRGELGTIFLDGTYNNPVTLTAVRQTITDNMFSYAKNC